MAPDAEHCESVRLNVEQVPVHHGRRILPDGQQPASAWIENEEERPGDNTNSPGENRRLLPASEPPAKHKSQMQAGLTLGVHNKYPQVSHKSQKTLAKTNFVKRKVKLIASLKPPYFILCMIIFLVFVHTAFPRNICAKMEWTPHKWWLQPWRLFTYGFVHASYMHLALNALMTLAVGWPLESEQGWWRVVVVWCGGVAAGALGAGVFQPHVRVVGASAAVYALLTAHIANVCLRMGHILLWWFRPLSVVVLCTSEILWALVCAAVAARDESDESVAWAAHILGAAVGIQLAFAVFTGEHVHKTYVVACRVVSVSLLVACTVAAVTYYAWPKKSHNYPAPGNICISVNDAICIFRPAVRGLG